VSRAAASRPAPSPRTTNWWRRVVPWWWAIAVPCLVGVSALFATSPIRDAATLEVVPEATLRLPTGYLLLAPLSNVLDTLTLLSLRQHIAVVLTLLVVFAIWWWRRGRLVPPTVSPSRRLVRHVARAGLALLGLIAIYALAVLLPRPMAALEVSANIVVVDFHTHTEYSHDGRPDWTPEDVRRWHHDAGYSVAYVTDHRTFEGAREGWANNSQLAGERTSLLPAIEVVWQGEHVNVLDADRVYRGLFTPTLRDVDPEAMRLASAVPGKEPIVIETLPGDLSHLIPATGPGTAGVRAIEIVDGSPKGLGQTRSQRARIVHLADSLHLALVTGSDSHGWGHVAQGWTLIVLPRWRAASPEQVADGISTTLRRGGFQGTRAVERRVADTERAALLPLTLPLVTWDMLRTLSGDERLAWIAWTVILAALYWLRERRRPVATR
jgi:hypothetical protein